MFKKIIISIVALSVVIVVTGLLVSSQGVQGAAPSGLPAAVSTSTTITVGTTPVKLFDSKQACASRVIRTQGQPLFFILNDALGSTVSSTTVKTIVGFHQAASTTVAYDSGLYGCGEVWGYAEVSTVLTTAELR